MSNQDCNCEQSERLKKELVEMCEAVLYDCILRVQDEEIESMYTTECKWCVRDVDNEGNGNHASGCLAGKAAEIKVRYSK